MTTAFRPRPQTSTLLFRERPHGDARYVEFTGSQGFSCFVAMSTLLKMSQWAADVDQEVLGRLGGRHCRDTQGPYILVERAVLCDAATGSAFGVQADEHAQRRLRGDFDSFCRAFDAVGWFHSHAPEVGLFFSGTDRANQRTWDHPDSIGIVLHPGLAGEGLRVYRGPASEDLRIASPGIIEELRESSTLASAAAARQIASTPVATAPPARLGASARNALATALGALGVAICALVVALQAGDGRATAHRAPGDPGVTSLGDERHFGRAAERGRERSLPTTQEAPGASSPASQPAP